MKTFLLTLLMIVGGFAYCQTGSDTTKQELKVITKIDGTQYVGVILSDDGREVLVETKELGKIYIPKTAIKSITAVGEEDIDEVGSYDPEGPFTTRYYFTTNALPLEKGDDYAMIHLYGPEVHFSLGKGFSAGIMTTWGASPFIVALKKSFRTKNEKVNFSLATLIGSSGYFNTFRGYGGIGFGTVTFGTPANNFSLSAGYGYIDPGFQGGGREVLVDDGFYSDENYEWSDIQTYNGKRATFQTPVFQVAGTKKLGKKTSLIFDSMISLKMSERRDVQNVYNYQNTGQSGYLVSTDRKVQAMFFLMPGIRFQKSPKNAFQVALAGCTYIRGNDAIAFPVPQCSWFFKF